MSVVTTLTELGGVATRAQLLDTVTRAELDASIRDGLVLSGRRSIYRLPQLAGAESVARAAGGVLSLSSAALHHGWAVKTVPDVPHIALKRGVRIRPELRRLATWHRADLVEDQCHGVATTKEFTLVQCLRQLPFDEALAIADSALRSGEIATVRRIARTASGPRAPRVRRIATLANGDAANPFESVLRAIAYGVPGLNVRPQVTIRSVEPSARPDLVDEHLRIVLEADSFEWHGDRAALRADARRYDRLVADGWHVLRFAWEDVMFDPEFVTQVIAATVAHARLHTELLRKAATAA